MVRHLSSEMRQQQIEWGRSQVLELSSEGFNQREIAQKLLAAGPAGFGYLSPDRSNRGQVTQLLLRI